jgi:PAS domain S-box-containing protein
MVGEPRSETELIRTVIEGTRLLIIALDQGGRIMRVNHALEEAAGLPQDAYKGPIWRLATLPDEQRLLERYFTPFKPEQIPEGLFFHLKCASPPARPVDWMVKVIQAEHGPVVVFTGVDLSERLAAEERLHETKELQRLILDRLPAIVWMTDPALRFTFSAGGGLSPLGLGTGQVAILGTSLYSYFHTSDPGHPVIAAHLQALRGESGGLEMPWNERVYEARVEALHDRQQQVIGCIGVALDVTELAHARQFQKRSEERIRRLVEANVLGVILWDSKGRITEANESFLDLVGFTRDELLSGAISWRELTPPEHHDRDDRALAEIKATGRCAPYQKEYVAKDGQRVPVLIGGAWVGERGHDAYEGVAFVLDLREQLRLRSARDELLLKEHKARVDTELANVRLLMLVTGSKRLARTMRIEDTLATLAELLVPGLGDWSYVVRRGLDSGPSLVASAHGDPNKRALLRGLHGCTLDPDAPAGAPQVFRTGETATYHDLTPEQLAPGTSGWTVVGTRDPAHLRVFKELGMSSVMCVPVRGRGGVDAVMVIVSASDPRRFDRDDVILAEDLAVRAAVALENGHLLAEALEAIEARDSFLSVAAHELRTPLTSMLLHIAKLKKAAEAGTLEAAAALRGIRSSETQAQRLSTLVDSLLDVVRLKAGLTTGGSEEIDIAQVVVDTVASMSPDAERAGCALDVTTSGSALGHWDRGRMEQVLRNLLSNALKFGAQRPIEVRVDATGESVRISVRDHGIGIAREDQSRIFHRFERAVSTSNFGGLGLGLYISNQILRAHGGSLRVESEPGKGARFIVELPHTEVQLYPTPPLGTYTAPPSQPRGLP